MELNFLAEVRNLLGIFHYRPREWIGKTQMDTRMISYDRLGRLAMAGRSRLTLELPSVSQVSTVSSVDAINVEFRT